jgi:hypothetical protein
LSRLNFSKVNVHLISQKNKIRLCIAEALT